MAVIKNVNERLGKLVIIPL